MPSLYCSYHQSHHPLVVLAVFVLGRQFRPVHHELVHYVSHYLAGEGEILHSAPALDEDELDRGQSHLPKQEEDEEERYAAAGAV
jgi:hypothetical protein